MGVSMVRITVSGHPGSGTSTLVSGLMDHYGWSSLNGGDVFREEAKRRGMSLADFGTLCTTDLEVDRQLDALLQERMSATGAEEIVESRLSGWWAYRLNLDWLLTGPGTTLTSSSGPFGLSPLGETVGLLGSCPLP